MVDPSTATVGRVCDWEKERIEASSARSHAADKAAYMDFERTARELAGEDQTLRRVLEARLVDAYHRGRSQEATDDNYYRFGWLEEWTPPSE